LRAHVAAPGGLRFEENCVAAKGMSWKDGAFVPAKGVEQRQGGASAASSGADNAPPAAASAARSDGAGGERRDESERVGAARGADRDIPPEVKWLADVLGLDPHFVMRNPTSYMRRTGGPAPMDGDLDPDRFD
jgi:hypothetical protein